MKRMKLKFNPLLYIFFVLSQALITRPALAGTPIRFTCSVPTTVFHVYTQDSNVITEISHPYGIKYTPLHRGTLPTVSLDKLNVQKNYVARLGNQQTFVWDLNKCTTRDSRIHTCTGGKSQTIDGLKIRPISFRTTLSNLSMTEGDYEIYAVEVVFLIEDVPEIANQMFSLSTDYSFARHCNLRSLNP